MKFLLAGGGTAGHVEPALAVARALKVQCADSEIEFVGTAQGLENTLVPAAGFSLHHIPKVAIARRVSPTLLLVPLQLVRSISTAVGLLRKVDCLIGFGGYVSGPMYIAALLTRTPIVIHEQNARPGWANRMGAHFTRFSAVSYPVSQGALSKAELTGLPLREDVLRALATAEANWASARARAKEIVCQRYGFSSELPLVFIFGGSQGSQAINAVISDAQRENVFTGVSVLHGVGKNNLIPASTPNYHATAYIDDMADLYLAADLIISRSGAVTCAEVSALGRYALFIPLPVGNGEQALNASSLVSAGRATVIEQRDFTATWLNAHLAELLEKSHASSVTADSSGATAVDKILALIKRATGVQ